MLQATVGKTRAGPDRAARWVAGRIRGRSKTPPPWCAGLRAVSDFEFEFQMALMNRKLEAKVETIFLMPKEEYTYLSSRIVKEIARLGGDIASFVPPLVVEAFAKKKQ